MKTNAFIDQNDIKEILNELANTGPDDRDEYTDGYFDALDDLSYANSLGLNNVENHLQTWDGFIAKSNSDHGYMAALHEFQEAVNVLIDERKFSFE